MSNFADSVWLGGHIYTVDQNFSVATALAVSGQTLMAVGSDEEISSLIGGNTVVYKLNGATVTPGFIESHIHLQMYGESILKLPIRDKSKKEILEEVEQAISKMKPGQWLEGGMGWNNEVWEDPSYPTKEELDAVSPNNPVLLPRMDGHLIWVNSKALELAGITEEIANPPGGEYKRKEDGSLSGCICNTACDSIRKIIPEMNKEQRKAALLAAQEKLVAYGVTSVDDMSTDYLNVEDLKELYESGQYDLRFYGALRGVLTQETDSKLQAYFERCPEINLYNQHFTVRAIKILGDGSVGAQSAALLEDYTDRPGYRGILMQTDEGLYQMVKQAAQRGMQVTIHTIGDAAIDQILRCYKTVLEEIPNPDHRFRIEHFQLVTGDSRERAKALGVIASMQPTHAPNSASMALRRLGEDRASRAYAGGMVLETLGMIAAGSDAPVAAPNPMDGMHSAVSRTNASLEPAGGFYPHNALTREQALKAYTIWGAYAQFGEKEKGSLEPGKLADFVILDQDIMNIPVDDLLRVKVLMTVIGGKIVYP